MILNRKGAQGGYILWSLLFILLISTGGCFKYSFTGTSIPDDVSTIYIPFFPDQSQSGMANLSNQLNDVLVNRFISNSKLQLANNRSNADAVLEGAITSYSNEPFTFGGDEETSENKVTIRVRATFTYVREDQPEWSSRSFSNFATYDPAENPIEGENNAAEEAMRKIANNMFNDAVGQW